MLPTWVPTLTQPDASGLCRQRSNPVVREVLFLRRVSVRGLQLLDDTVSQRITVLKYKPVRLLVGMGFHFLRELQEDPELQKKFGLGPHADGWRATERGCTRPDQTAFGGHRHIKNLEL